MIHFPTLQQYVVVAFRVVLTDTFAND